MIRTMISTTKPIAIFQRASMNRVDHSITTPSTIPAASAPNASPIPPRIDRGEDRQQQLEAELGLGAG